MKYLVFEIRGAHVSGRLNKDLFFQHPLFCEMIHRFQDSAVAKGLYLVDD